jgi:hypothetical protein
VDDHPVAVMFDFVDPVGSDRRLSSFNRLSGDDEPGGKVLGIHCREKIGRRDAGNNELSVVFSLGLQLLPPPYPMTVARPCASAQQDHA